MWITFATVIVIALLATPAKAAPDFSGSPRDGNLNLDVTFTPIDVTGVPDSTTWDFGDGTTVTESSGTPSVQNHTYTAPGAYDVILTVWYTATPDSVITKLDYITVSPIDFMGAPRMGAVPLTVTFTPSGTADADSIQWVWGDSDILWRYPPFGNVAHTYNTGPTTFTVEMHAFYDFDDSTVTKLDYIETVNPSVVQDSVNSASCFGVADSTLPDTVYYTYFAPPAVTDVWFYVRYDTTTGNVPFDSLLVSASPATPFTYVFTSSDDFWVKAVPFNVDSTWTWSIDSVGYTSSDCYCVKGVADGFSIEENYTLMESVLDNDTLGVFGDPQPVDSARVIEWHPDKADTAYFDTLENGTYQLVYDPIQDWHGKDTLVYSAWIENGCSPSVATVYITIFSDDVVDIDTIFYEWKDACTNTCDSDPSGTVSGGDSLRIWLKINPIDVQEVAPGWPKVWFAELGGSASGDVMFKDTTAIWGDDSTWYSIPFQDTAGTYPDWIAVANGGADTASGLMPIAALIVSDLGLMSFDTAFVVQSVDTKPPIAEPSRAGFVHWYDVNGDGIAQFGDSVAIWYDLSTEPPGEICQGSVLATLWNWPSTGNSVPLTLTDPAGDQFFWAFYEIEVGDISPDAGPFPVVISFSDDACNVDSTDATLITPVMNGFTLTVWNLSDSGPGSLRSVIDSANAFPGPDTIIVDVPEGSIRLETALPALTDETGGTYIRNASPPWMNRAVTIDGSNLSSGSGMHVTSDDNVVENLIIQSFPDNGITVTGSAIRNRFTSNLFSGNGGLAIDLLGDGITPNDDGDSDTGPNDLLNYPVFDSIREVGTDTFTVYGTAAANAIIELYLATEYGSVTFLPENSRHGPAYELLGIDTADGTGFFEIDSIMKPEWSRITATATDALGNTSELSRNKPLSADPLRVTAYTDQLEVRVYGPPDSNLTIDSIGPTFNTFHVPASYDMGDFNDDDTMDVRVTINSPDTGFYAISMKLVPGGTPGTYLTGIGIDGHLEAQQAVALASADDVYDTTHHHAPPTQNRGDFDGDGFVTALDLTVMIDILFAGVPVPDPPELADADCDGFPTALDLTYIIDYIFANGPLPCLK
jgi:PKD repeat protein